MTTIKSISAQALRQKDLKQALIVDVRTPMEFAEKRLVLPTTLAPVTELDPHMVALRSGALADTPIYTLCASGRRAQTAAAKFAEAGFTDITVIEGGLAACKEAGFPTAGQALPKTGETSPTLDRQVRLVAGALTALFVLLGLFVHKAFLAAGRYFPALPTGAAWPFCSRAHPGTKRAALAALAPLELAKAPAQAASNAPSLDAGTFTLAFLQRSSPCLHPTCADFLIPLPLPGHMWSGLQPMPRSVAPL